MSVAHSTVTANQQIKILHQNPACSELSGHLTADDGMCTGRNILHLTQSHSMIMSHTRSLCISISITLQAVQLLCTEASARSPPLTRQ